MNLIQQTRQVRVSENLVLLVLAMTVGLATGGGVWLFRRGIELFHAVFQVWLAQEIVGRWLGPFGIVAALALAGLAVGWLMDRFIGVERHHGVAGIMEAVALTGGRLRYQRAPIKAFTAALSLGAGASVGPEDPSVQIGANLGSFFGQQLHLSEDRVRVLVAAGTASAVAAAFNAPIAGVFFALEVILGEFTTRAVGVVVLASVMASAFTQAVEVGGPELGTLTYRLGGPLEIPLYVPLGLLLAPFAVLFIRMVYWQHDLWHRLDRVPRPIRTTAAGVLVGIVGVFLPEILGTGQEPMRAVLSGHSDAALAMLVALGVAKLILTPISLAGGFQGGVFAPSLFIGTMFGASFGQLVAQIFGPAVTSDPQAYAIAGMAGMMAGVLRAPITAILLVFELTNDYRLILPIMLTTVVCMVVAERMEPHSIYALGLWRKGVRLKHGRDVDLMQNILVRDVMRTPAKTISEGDSLADLRQAFRDQAARTLMVLDHESKLAGIVTLSDLQRAYTAEPDGVKRVVGEICTRSVITAQPDDPLGVVMSRMAVDDVMSLPVVASGSGDVLGVIARRDVVRAYQLAMAQKQEDQHQVETIRLGSLTHAHVFELYVEVGATIVGHRVSEIKWPSGSLVASIRRLNQSIVPNGSTLIHEADRVTVIAAPDQEKTLAALFSAPR